MKINTRTFKQWQDYFMTSFSQTLRHESPDRRIHMLRCQCTLAANVGGVVQKKIIRRQKNKAGEYSERMMRDHADECYSLAWYERHIEKLYDKIDKINKKQDSVRQERGCNVCE